MAFVRFNETGTGLAPGCLVQRHAEASRDALSDPCWDGMNAGFVSLTPGRRSPRLHSGL